MVGFCQRFTSLKNINYRINTKHKKTDFGDVWYVNATNNTFRFALYKYDDDADTIYLSNVFVNEDSRGQGYGNVILDSAEKAAEKMGARTICLKVKNSSFAYEWYKRHRYTVIEKEENYIWMKKLLIKPIKPYRLE